MNTFLVRDQQNPAPRLVRGRKYVQHRATEFHPFHPFPFYPENVASEKDSLVPTGIPGAEPSIIRDDYGKGKN